MRTIRLSDRTTATPVSPSSFVQQGTVDWTRLANASVNASVSVLTRLSGCGVELWTVSLAQVILGTIRLSAEGESHLNEALDKLHSFGSYGNAMLFGFGVKHIVRTLADSSEGMATVAICAAITEAHGMAISTQIVQEYAKLFGTYSDGALMPSYRQWEALVNACSGVLSRSPFGSIAEFFMKFSSHEHICGEPAQIARALEGLAKISGGRMKSMVLMGNSECGFLAAIAQWLLGLRVVVQTATGDVVYPSTDADTKNYQLLIIFADDLETSRTISRTADTYYISDFTDIYRVHSGLEYLSGRVDWETALTQSFGHAARKLRDTSGILGDTIGSAAKIYSEFSRDAPRKSGSRERFGKYNQYVTGRYGPDVSGQAFLDLARKRLPELACCKDAMELAVERSYEDACLHFEKDMALLKETCGCSRSCYPPADESSSIHLANQNQNERIKVTLSTTSSAGRQYCLRLLAHTIIQLVRQISTVASMPADLGPKRRGLHALFAEVEEKYPDRWDSPTSDIQFLDAFDSMGLIDLATLVFGVEHHFAYTERSSSQRLDKVSVAVNGGLCFILDSVMSISSRAEDSLRIHIIPGHIEWNQKLYHKVRDSSLGFPGGLMSPILLPVSEAGYKAQMRLIDNMTARAVITESSECLRMSWEIATAWTAFLLGPAALNDGIANATSDFSCTGKTCRPFTGLEERFYFTLYNMRLPYPGFGNELVPSDMPEKPNIILFGGNQLARCAAVAMNIFGAECILQESECIYCCARRALTAEKPNEQVIISSLTAEDLEHLLGKPGSLILEE